MEQSIPWEANSRSASQEILAIYATRRFITVFAKASTGAIPSQMQFTTSHPIFNIHSNIILPSTPMSSK
jgi:hypothetical protein